MVTAVIALPLFARIPINQAAALALRGSHIAPPSNSSTGLGQWLVDLVPQNVVHLEGKDAVNAVKLVAALEDSDDVQNVFSNMDVDESVLESAG